MLRLSRYFTRQELENMKFYELPNYIYNAILEEIKETIGVLTKRLIEIFNNSLIFELDQYVNIDKYIIIIA